MDRINLLKKLTAAPGLSAAESGIAAVLQSELERLGLKAHIDSFGNVHAVMPSENKDAFAGGAHGSDRLYGVLGDGGGTDPF